MVMNYTEVESKVREATNDEAWGPTGELRAGGWGGIEMCVSVCRGGRLNSNGGGLREARKGLRSREGERSELGLD